MISMGREPVLGEQAQKSATFAASQMGLSLVFMKYPRLVAAALAATVTLVAPPAVTDAPKNETAPELDAAVRAIVHDGTLKSAQVSIEIIDVDSGHVLAASNEHLALNPASNAKLYTAAVSLAMLHGDHRYETTISGNLKKDAVGGGIVLRGHGDPSLRTADLYAMVQEMRAQGVRRIDGDILVDQKFFDEQTTPPAFDQQPNEWSYFRAPVSAVALNENCVTMTVRPNSVGSPAFVSFDPPGFVDVDGSISTSEKGADNVGMTLSPNGKRLSVKIFGSVAEDTRVTRFTKRVDDPNLLAGYALKALLDKAEIKVTGEVKAGTLAKAKTIARHQSAPLSQLLYPVGKNSDNFYAEMIFKTIGGETKSRPAKSEGGAEQVTKWLEKVGAMDQGVVIKNGSGLFDANRVTAHSVVQLLKAAWKDPQMQAEFVAQLAIGGVDGTLEKRFRGEKTRRMVRAKTGTLDDAIALSGYVMGPPGKGPIAFAIIFNKVAGKASGARAAADKLVELIARRLHK
jgi:D-alanyl-D-alanine carboxypeptidase/D-alanyl-D-alanine-endopeptidase (penicillin-binding protein 4)